MAQLTSKRLVPWLLGAAFALLACAMVMIHISDTAGEVSLKQATKGRTSLAQELKTVQALLKHPKQFASALMGGVKPLKSIKTAKLEEEGDGEEEEEEGSESEGEDSEESEHTEYYHSSFPTFNRKGVGPGLSVGDPVLNKKNKNVFERPCELEDECEKDSDEKYYDWRNLKQERMTANEDMYNQMLFLFKTSGYQMAQCDAGFHDDEEKAEMCEHKVARAMCYKFESINQMCDWTEEARHNRPDGTVYWNKYYMLEACHENEARDAMQELCLKAEKLPGVSVSHWPWQGHSMNLNHRGFSGDYLLGPYGWSGRMDSKYA